MPKKPRTRHRMLEVAPPRPRIRTELTRQVLKQEFHNCDHEGCANIIATSEIPVGYNGPIYCVLHRDPVHPG